MWEPKASSEGTGCLLVMAGGRVQNVGRRLVNAGAFEEKVRGQSLHYLSVQAIQLTLTSYYTVEDPITG